MSFGSDRMPERPPAGALARAAALWRGLAARGVTLLVVAGPAEGDAGAGALTGARVRTRGPAGAVTEDDAAAIREHKAALLWLLQDEQDAGAALAGRVLEAVDDPRAGDWPEDSAVWLRLLRLVRLVEALDEAERGGPAGLRPGRARHPGPDAPRSLYGALHGLRAGGAQLWHDPAAHGGRGGWRIAPRLSPKVALTDDETGEVHRAAGDTLWETADEYRQDARDSLLPHRALLVRLLAELPP